MTHKRPLYIGLMSGTSLDGIDAVLVRFQNESLKIVRHASIDYPASLQKQFLALLTPAENELERIQLAQHRRTALASKVVDSLCEGFDRANIASIADHGQTIRHFPNNKPPYTIQIHQGARLVKMTGITTVVDFRSKDIADGGQGAPLVPAFHQAFFADQRQYRVIVNIGGIANISLLPPVSNQGNLGFDTGPGNTLLDIWCQQHTGKEFDDQGQWASSGIVDEQCLAHLLDDPYFGLAPPKSTGREQFNLGWLKQKLQKHKLKNCAHNDIQATLTALTTRTIHFGIQQACKQAEISMPQAVEGIYLCGGGAYNTHLVHSLQQEIDLPVRPSDALGVPPKLVEAAAFAWYGKMAIAGLAVDLRQATGAKHANILGAIYPA